MSVDALVEHVAAVEAVDAIRLTGSRDRGDPTPLSDWDYEIATTDFASVAAALPAAVAPLRPLAAFWDPLGNRPNFTVLLDGPTKVDLIFDGHPFTPSPPWVPSPGTLPAIDAHFWDWTLWLGAKRLRGDDDLVHRQLARLHEHLLAPLGVRAPPTDLRGAVETYLEARHEHEARYGVTVDPQLGDQVRAALTTELESTGRNGARRRDGAVPVGTGLRRPHAGVEVHVHDAEAVGVALGPLEVVEQRPDEEAA